MNYEKKYKEAQKWIESIYSELSHEQQMEAEAFFPELKESEDERIRKELMDFIYVTCFPAKELKKKERFLAWLEKQEGCEYIKKDWLEHIKQSWYKEGFIDGKYTPKEWTINDATTLNELIDFLENGTVKLQHDLTLYANWLKTQFSPIEKQGEQKDICGKCKKAQPYHSCQDITALGRCYIEGMNTANKDEPKFHEGEWITNGDYTWKIVEVKPLDYILQSQNGSIVDDTISHVDEQFHSFTIKDAKDGDVLAAHECVVLFKEIDGLNIKCYCTYHYIGFNPSFYVDTLQNKTAFQPATKELRDLLFQKMKEAGYEWDENNKMLKEIVEDEEEPQNYKNQVMSEITDLVKHYIKQKPACSEAGEDIKEAFRTEYEKGRADAFAQMQQGWSDKEKQMYADIIEATKKSGVFKEAYKRELVDFLNFLKERHTWKPSEKQMNAFEQVYDWYNNNFAPSETLTSLYNDLKKLREE